ncbi:MAG: hypothetical protein ACOYNG_00830 [Terrimicrobiaceae bacterium]|jgi:hypothetical protein
MRKLAKNETRLLILFAAAVFVALNLFAVRAWLTQRGALDAAIASAKSRLAMAEGLVTAASALEDAEGWIKQNPPPEFSPEAASTDLLNTVRALAEKNTLKIAEETLLPSDEADTAVLQTKINGPFNGVAEFLFALQSPTDWRSIKKMAIRSDSEPPNVVVDMEIRQHYRAAASGAEPPNP